MMSDHGDLTEELRALMLEAECCAEGVEATRKDLMRLEVVLGRLAKRLGEQIERREVKEGRLCQAK